jgi:CO/xanthine dehydrogenase Mo-binding subunit
VSKPAVRRWVGKPIKVKEDRRFVQGKGLYSDDFQLKGMLFAAVLRSPHAHAKIKSIDVSKAARLKGVVATMTGAELAISSRNTPWPLRRRSTPARGSQRWRPRPGGSPRTHWT